MWTYAKTLHIGPRQRFSIHCIHPNRKSGYYCTRVFHLSTWSYPRIEKNQSTLPISINMVISYIHMIHMLILLHQNPISLPQNFFPTTQMMSFNTKLPATPLKRDCMINLHHLHHQRNWIHKQQNHLKNKLSCHNTLTLV